MAVFNRAVTAGVAGTAQIPGLRPEVINWNAPLVLGSYAAAATNNVFTKQTFASTINASSAPGSNIDFPRNLQYQISLTNGSASSLMISGGSFIALGRLDNGKTVGETIAFSQVRALSSALQGTVVFARVDTLSFSNVSLHTSASSASNSVSFSVGQGNKIGLPQSVKQTNPGPIPWLWIGTSIQLTTSHTASSSSNAYTVITGQIGTAGISLSNGLATGTPVLIRHILNR